MMPIATTPRPPSVRDAITRLQEQWPVGTPVVHTESGLQGVVVLEPADRVPCTSLPDESSAWCLLPSRVAHARSGTEQHRAPGRGAAICVALTTGERVWWRVDFLQRVHHRRRLRHTTGSGSSRPRRTGRR